MARRQHYYYPGLREKGVVAMARRIENGRIADRNDVRWAHPGLVDYWYIDGRKTVNKFTNPEKTLEERVAKRDKMYGDIAAGHPGALALDPTLEEHGETTVYTAPGCPEEPDTEVKVYVRAPKNRKRRKANVVFYIAGGAFLLGTPYLGPIEELSRDYDCVVVAPWYRTALDAQYPAAINDFHAAYQWMADHSDELNINMDKVVLSGMSAGSAFALAFAFRLKRYGFRPRGVVALDPAATDDRAVYASHQYNSDAWDGDQIHRTMMAYFGPEDFASAAIGPEGMANHATVEDCHGLCPVIIHSSESDADRDSLMSFAGKLYAAGVYCETHFWGGCCHATLYNAPKDVPERMRYQQIVDGNFRDLWKYDMRREWLVQPESDTTQE